MNIFIKLRTFLKDPKAAISSKIQDLEWCINSWLLSEKIYKKIPDKLAVKTKYWVVFGKYPNLKNPKTFNEKLAWCKIYDRKPKYTMMVDKLRVRETVQSLIGEDYLIPLLNVWDSPDEINLASLPKQFVLKWNHDSGSVIICKDKAEFNFDDALRKLKGAQNNNHYQLLREWPYKNVRPKLFAERYMKCSESDNLPVYKFFCFDGEPRIVQFIQNDKTAEETVDYFSVEWELLPIRQYYPNSTKPIAKPDCLGEMLNLARRLAVVKKGFIRVDLYLVDNRIYFSEYTFFSDGAMTPFTPEEWDLRLGEWINLGGLKDE